MCSTGAAEAVQAACGAQLARTGHAVLVPGANEGLDDHEGDGVRIVPGRALEGDCKVQLGHVRVPDAHVATREHARRLPTAETAAGSQLSGVMSTITAQPAAVLPLM